MAPEDQTAAVRGATTTARYVYGVVRAGAGDAADLPAGIDGADVDHVVHGEIAALASPVERDYVRAARRDLLAHTEVLREALRSGPVLPLSFGTVFADGDSVVREFLEPRHDELRRLLEEFEHDVELSVKAFYREDVVLAEIVRDNPEIAQLRQKTQTRPQAATYGLRITLGEAVARELEARRQADAGLIVSRLRQPAKEVVVDDRPVEHLVVKAAFLVGRDSVAEFDAAVSALAEELDERMQFKYVGPLAPHSFVGLVLPESR